MGDCLLTGKPRQYTPNHLSQLSLLSVIQPTWGEIFMGGRNNNEVLAYLHEGANYFSAHRRLFTV